MYPAFKVVKAKRILKNKLKKDLKENSKKPGKKPLEFVNVMIKECYYLKDISTRQYTNHEGMDLQTNGVNSFPLNKYRNCQKSFHKILK